MDKYKIIIVSAIIAVLFLAIFLSFFAMDIIVRIGTQSVSMPIEHV